jgi:hypothetical protein
MCGAIPTHHYVFMAWCLVKQKNYFTFTLHYFILFYFILFHFISFHFILLYLPHSASSFDGSFGTNQEMENGKRIGLWSVKMSL